MPNVIAYKNVLHLTFFSQLLRVSVSNCNFRSREMNETSKKNYFNNQVKNRFGGLCFDPKNSLDLPKKRPQAHLGGSNKIMNTF